MLPGHKGGWTAGPCSPWAVEGWPETASGHYGQLMRLARRYVRFKLLHGSVGRHWVRLLVTSWDPCFIGSLLLEMESRL